MRRFLPRLTFANVIASLALFIALGGAAVAAGLPKNSVGPNQLKRGSVTPKALRKAAVTSGKIKPRAVTAGKIGPNAVLPGNLGAGIINSSKISAGAVNAEKIRNNVVTTNKLNNRGVTGPKIAVKGVENANLDELSVTTGKIAEGAVTAAKLADGSVTAAKLNPEVSNMLNVVQPLKSGQTQRGVFDLGGLASLTAEAPELVSARGSISFQQALGITQAVSVLAKGQSTAACPGTGGGGASPVAAPNSLCIYLTTETNLDPVAPLAIEVPNRLGTGLVAKAKEKTKGEFVAAGVWAVTAP